MTDPSRHWSHYVEPGSRHCLLCREHECELTAPCKRTQLARTLTRNDDDEQAEHLGQLHCGHTQIDAYGTHLTVELAITGDDYEVVVSTSAERAYHWACQLHAWLDKHAYR